MPPLPLPLPLPLLHPSASPRFHTLPLSLSSSPFSLFPAGTSISAMSLSFSSSPSPSPSPSTSTKSDRHEGLSQVLKYHNQTKHAFTKYARGPHGLDWANQPNPFRRYLSAPLLPLLHFPTPDQSPAAIDGRPQAPLYHSLFHSLPPPTPLSKPALSQFLYDSLALSAWKTAGFSTWSLRVNPSSGNLHPTEAYIVSPPIESVSNSGFVAHYAPKEHGLEIRAEIPARFFAEFFPENTFLVGLSSIFWREAWKYGERAFRYCNHDVGHAIGAVAMSAAALGWDVKVLDGFGYEELKKLMGLDKFAEFRTPLQPVRGKIPEIEFEHPDCVLAVFPSGINEFDVNYEELSKAVSEFSNLEWKGTPNSLSKEHVCWDIIYRTAEVVKKPVDLDNKDRFFVDPFRSRRLFSESAYKGFTVREIVRKRRSAVDMDGVTVMERDAFYQILLHCLPSGSGSEEGQKRPLALPFRALPWDAEVHAALFVHRVDGLPQALYFLVRNEEHFGELKKSMRPGFKWSKPEGCPDELPLYELDRGDYRRLSQRLSCHQDIASDGCFSLGMVAHFEPVLRNKRWMYPRLFWETGVLGQVLYLEAHAVGVSATGIGCYFDDPMHEVLGIKGSNFQSLYHFTVGGPVLDKRIMSLPAYPGPGIDA